MVSDPCYGKLKKTGMERSEALKLAIRLFKGRRKGREGKDLSIKDNGGKKGLSTVVME